MKYCSFYSAACICVLLSDQNKQVIGTMMSILSYGHSTATTVSPGHHHVQVISQILWWLELISHQLFTPEHCCIQLLVIHWLHIHILQDLSFLQSLTFWLLVTSIPVSHGACLLCNRWQKLSLQLPSLSLFHILLKCAFLDPLVPPFLLQRGQ